MRSRGAGRRRTAALVALLLVVAIACGTLLAAGCTVQPGSAGSVTGSGNAVAKVYDSSGFTRVRLDNTCDATVTRGDTFLVDVTVDDNVAQHLVVEVKGDTLHIGLDPSYGYSDITLKAQVVMPDLQGLELSGAALAGVSGFSSDSPLQLELSGSSRANLRDMRSGDVTFEISGASSLSGELRSRELKGEASGASRAGLEGSGTTAEVEASGGSSLGLRFFAVGDADVELSGGSRGQVRVSSTLNADVSGGSQLDYFGSPTLGNVDVSGGSELNRAAD